MRIETKYICDKCGTLCADHTNTLTIIFQRPYENLGATHFCDKCKVQFKGAFKQFLKTKTMLSRQGWKSIKLL